MQWYQFASNGDAPSVLWRYVHKVYSNTPELNLNTYCYLTFQQCVPVTYLAYGVDNKKLNCRNRDNYRGNEEHVWENLRPRIL